MFNLLQYLLPTKLQLPTLILLKIGSSGSKYWLRSPTGVRPCVRFLLAQHEWILIDEYAGSSTTELHRTNGPAIVTNTGTTYWYKSNKKVSEYEQMFMSTPI